VKTSAPGWVRVNAALFSVTTQNEIVVDQNVGGRATFKNVGRTKRRGVELAAETLGTGPWEARAAYTHLSATFEDAYTTQVLNAGGQVPVPAGSMIPGVPESVLYAEVRYRREPFVVQLEGLRKSRVAVNDPNTDFADGHTVLNAMAGLVQQGTTWRLMEFVRIDNLTDRNYAGSVIVNEGNARYFEPSPRRSIFVGAQANMRF
jgi:iron complex outermembrane recepter protein